MRARMMVGVAVIALAAMAAWVSGCGGSSGVVDTGTGRMGILLTDNPSPFEQVLVTVSSVQAHQPGGGWVTVVTKDDVDAVFPQPIDLLTLRNLEKLIGVGTLPAGTYTQFRIVLLPGAEVVLPGDEHRPLLVPSGVQTGLKAHGCVVPPDGISYLLVDIDTDRIIPPQGASTDYILPPTAITVSVYGEALGSLYGTVEPADSGAVVTAFWADTTVPAGQATIDGAGAWEIPDLLPEEYYVTATAAGFEAFDSRPTLYEVTAGAATEVPLITLTPTP